MIKKQNKILTLLTWETINVIELYCFYQFCQSCDRNFILAILVLKQILKLINQR